MTFVYLTITTAIAAWPLYGVALWALAATRHELTGPDGSADRRRRQWPARLLPAPAVLLVWASLTAGAELRFTGPFRWASYVLTVLAIALTGVTLWAAWRARPWRLPVVLCTVATLGGTGSAWVVGAMAISQGMQK